MPRGVREVAGDAVRVFEVDYIDYLATGAVAVSTWTVAASSLADAFEKTRKQRARAGADKTTPHQWREVAGDVSRLDGKAQ